MPTVQAATLVAPYKLEVHDYPYPSELEPGAVLLRMIASGICGTDKHTFRGEVEQYPGSETQRGATYPLIQGHENVGIVEAVGEGAAAYAGDGTPLEPGDRVVPAPNRACGHCAACQRGFPYFLCTNLDSYGNALAADVAPHLFGGWSQYLYLKPRTGHLPRAGLAARRRGGADGDLRRHPQPRARRGGAEARRASGPATRSR